MNFYFSIAPIINALPFGSAAKYSPGTILLQPVFPNVSYIIFINLYLLVSNSRIIIRPESDPITKKCVYIPNSLNARSFLTKPKTS